MNHIGTPPTIILDILNAGKERRPSGSAENVSSPSLTTLADIRYFLARWGIQAEATEDDVAPFTQLQGALNNWTMQTGDRLAALSSINSMAMGCRWVLQMDETGAPIREASGPPAAQVAARCIEELAECDPTRLKQCEGQWCTLIFYDTTRNRSGKWHAEDPCGWRARAARR